MSPRKHARLLMLFSATELIVNGNAALFTKWSTVITRKWVTDAFPFHAESGRSNTAID